MIEGTPICEKCPIQAVCHPSLRPERIKFLFNQLSGAVIQPIKHIASSNCRHLACPVGIDAALIASMGEGIWPRQFGSVHKPFGRVVNECGAIMSEQDGQYYPTGQVVHI